jgi:hypothetical protein
MWNGIWVVFLPKRATRKSELRLEVDHRVGVTFRVTKRLILTAFFDSFRTQIGISMNIDVPCLISSRLYGWNDVQWSI